MTFLGYERLRAKEFLGLSTFQFLAYFRRSIFYGFVAVYLGKHLGLSTFEVTLMATFGMIANAGSQSFIWGSLLDRFRRSALFIIIGESIAGVGHIAWYYWHLSALRQGNDQYAGFTIIIGLAIIEIFWSQSNVGWSALISELTESTKRKKLMSQLSIIGGIGGIVGATLGGYLYLSGQGFENGNLFIIPAIIMIISSVIVYFSIRDPEERLKSDTNLSDVQSLDQSNESEKKPSLADLPNNLKALFILLLIVLVFVNFGRNSIALISSLYVVDEGSFAASDQQLALFRNFSSGATMIAGFLLGSILSEVDDRKMMMTGIIFALFALVWLILAPSFELVLLASALVGATQVILQASSYAIVSTIIPPEYRGRLFAYYNATFFLSWGIGGSLVAAPVADYFIIHGYTSAFAYQMSFVSAIFLVLIGLICYLYFLRRLNEYREKVDIEF